MMFWPRYEMWWVWVNSVWSKCKIIMAVWVASPGAGFSLFWLHLKVTSPLNSDRLQNIVIFFIFRNSMYITEIPTQIPRIDFITCFIALWVVFELKALGSVACRAVLPSINPFFYVMYEVAFSMHCRYTIASWIMKLNSLIVVFLLGYLIMEADFVYAGPGGPRGHIVWLHMDHICYPVV